MEDKFLILKLSFLCLLLSINSFAISVIISKESIKFEEKIDSSKVRLQNVNEINKACIPLKLSEIQNNEYISTHYINKNTIICQKDVKKYEEEGIIFNFGGLKIEKKGKIIYENDEFIRIKNLDGTIEQIYKDGRIK
jgi:flagella basal body P-ring formation protein FlgA